MLPDCVYLSPFDHTGVVREEHQFCLARKSSYLMRQLVLGDIISISFLFSCLFFFY